jgi:GAF domain-containing protein
MSNEHAIAEGIRVSFARLRRIIADLRSGLLGTSVSSNLMAAVAESLDRGVLFVPHLERLVALGAFGNAGSGAPLSRTTQGLILSVGTSGVFKECIVDSRPRRIGYDDARLPQAFLEAVDRPRTGEIAVLPVPGSERVIAAIYLDNGARDRPIGDIEIFELAAFQLGLALENEFLRRANPSHEVASAIAKMRAG